MKPIILLTALILSKLLSGQSISSQSGDWSNSLTWGITGVPGAGEMVTIEHDVDYDISGGGIANYGMITVASGATLTLNANTDDLVTNQPLGLLGTIVISDNATLEIQGNFTLDATGILSLLGDSSFVRIINQGATNVEILGNLTIDRGILAVRNTGSATIDFLVTSTVTIGDGGSLYFEGNNGTFTNNGSMTIEAGGQLVSNVSNNRTLTNNGTITMEYGSSYYQSPSSSDLTFSGDKPIFQIGLTGSGGLWRQFSSPFTNYQISNFDGTSFQANITSGQENMFYYNAGTAGSTGGNAPGWTEVTNKSSVITPGDYCYAVYCGDANFPLLSGNTINFTTYTLPTLGNHTYDIAQNYDPLVSQSTASLGWCLVGNPYPTWLDLEAVMSDDDNDGGGVGGLGYYGAHLWNASAGQYVVYLANSEASITQHTNNNANSTPTTNRYLRPFQAFWVKDETNALSALTIKPEHRSLIHSAPNYMKAQTNSNQLRLNAFAATDSAWDQILIVADPTKSALRIGSEDAYDRPSGNYNPNMALLHQDGTKLCIDSRPLNQLTVFPLFFEQGIDQESYYLSLDDTQYDASADAYIEDLKTGDFHSLELGDYSFVHDVNFPQPRFKIHFSPTTIGVNEVEATNSKIRFWTGNHQLYLSGVDHLVGNVTFTVFDFSGREVYNFTQEVNGNEMSIPVPQELNGVFIVRASHPSINPITFKTYWK